MNKPPNSRFAGIALDHRQVRPGFLFAALPGVRLNGEDFIEAAVQAGAVAVLARPHVLVPSGIVHIPAVDPRQMLALLAADFYGPAPEFLAAVTGSNGKTSVAVLVRQLWAAQGFAAASIGTLGIQAPGVNEETGLTTPDVLRFHATLAALAAQGVTHAVFEASSHGLDQARMDGRVVQVAAFTNLTRDHLDYHGDMAAYGAAKARLFRDLLAPNGTAVLWADDPYAPTLAALTGARCVRVGQQAEGCDVQLRAVVAEAGGQQLDIRAGGEDYQILLPLIGLYQAHNALVAAEMVVASGVERGAVYAALEQVSGVPGRLQQAAHTATGAAIYVDYAHTPDGIRAALAALRPHTPGRLLIVMGCGGDRDAGKRPLMGQEAAQGADWVCITDDNPRSEDPAAIRAAVRTGAPGALDIGDRRAAIAAAIATAQAGDTVLIAGKGHERGQSIAGEVLPFEDVLVAQEEAGRDAQRCQQPEDANR